ncbi:MULTISPECIES: hypothetical protein [unclassified Paenibacillus]|uniref:hypothetical protein n=1 Tax=unclassified Paenibacillus TaxID=185978 RepID=UPI001AE439B2|nr:MULTISPECIES: hypothetical protein [unclassified Paenibacillus]MBP1155668.1 hypothetical protein [Paenibacillus sp. PvP091]MBP1168946.1 hypothetical protein [Paenibacillus sp. PvR098]MBP2439974.1 hypothetical protein [Paenibacillus sp. PvP052]
MFYVLRHTQTGEIAAYIQKNNYDLDYYGAKQWDDKSMAEQEKDAFLSAIGHDDPDLWQVLPVNESRLKIFNVKLKNDPTRKLCLDPEGNMTVHSVQDA